MDFSGVSSDASSAASVNTQNCDKKANIVLVRADDVDEEEEEEIIFLTNNRVDNKQAKK